MGFVGQIMIKLETSLYRVLFSYLDDILISSCKHASVHLATVSRLWRYGMLLELFALREKLNPCGGVKLVVTSQFVYKFFLSNVICISEYLEGNCEAFWAMFRFQHTHMYSRFLDCRSKRRFGRQRVYSCQSNGKSFTTRKNITLFWLYERTPKRRVFYWSKQNKPLGTHNMILDSLYMNTCVNQYT